MACLKQMHKNCRHSIRYENEWKIITMRREYIEDAFDWEEAIVFWTLDTLINLFNPPSSSGFKRDDEPKVYYTWFMITRRMSTTSIFDEVCHSFSPPKFVLCLSLLTKKIYLMVSYLKKNTHTHKKLWHVKIQNNLIEILKFSDSWQNSYRKFPKIQCRF